MTLSTRDIPPYADTASIDRIAQDFQKSAIEIGGMFRMEKTVNSGKRVLIRSSNAELKVSDYGLQLNNQDLQKLIVKRFRDACVQGGGYDNTYRVKVSITIEEVRDDLIVLPESTPDDERDKQVAQLEKELAKLRGTTDGESEEL